MPLGHFAEVDSTRIEDVIGVEELVCPVLLQRGASTCRVHVTEKGASRGEHQVRINVQQALSFRSSWVAWEGGVG